MREDFELVPADGLEPGDVVKVEVAGRGVWVVVDGVDSDGIDATVRWHEGVRLGETRRGESRVHSHAYIARKT